jgi:3-hydroxyisobutyrate dehydrogenase-like beta-hydroxyacid dehydrogenase
MNIGFIGIGVMGSGMAANILKKGHKLTVFDLQRSAAQPLVAAGAIWADSPLAAAENNDVVFTSLPGPAEAEGVALGPNGILEGVRPGAAYIDLSSNSPTVVRRICQRFKEKGASMLDSPVSGGPAAAKSGTLSLMVGGDQEVYEKYLPLLQALGDKITYAGGIGNGSICKLMHNCTLYGLQAIVAECLTLGVKAGVDPRALWRVLREGAVGQAVLFQRSLPETYFKGRFEPPNFALKLAFKDVALATSLGREYDVPMALSNLTFQEMLTAMNRGWGNKDSRSAMLLQEERAGGIQVRIPESEIVEEVQRYKT